MAAIAAPFSSLASDLDDLEKSVVQLKGSVAVTETVQGVAYEVLLKDTRTGAVLPKKSVSAGTGFLVRGSRLLFLVTARHVAVTMTADGEVIARGPGNTPLSLHMSDLLKMSDTSPAPPTLWIHHPLADCSIHPINQASPGAAKLINTVPLRLDMLPAGPVAPARSAVLTVLGFPLGKGADAGFSPISRDSKPASGIMTEGPVSFFYLQQPSVDGYSGAPVFESGDLRLVPTSPNSAATVSGQPRCWGTITCTDLDSSGGKMARVIPSGYIAEMIVGMEHTIAVLTATQPPEPHKSVAPPSLPPNTSTPVPAAAATNAPASKH